jgi:hypothetical protein
MLSGVIFWAVALMSAYICGAPDERWRFRAPAIALGAAPPQC